MTQEELAEFSSLSVNFISKIERTGNQNISIQKCDCKGTTNIRNYFN